MIPTGKIRPSLMCNGGGKVLSQVTRVFSDTGSIQELMESAIQSCWNIEKRKNGSIGGEKKDAVTPSTTTSDLKKSTD